MNAENRDRIRDNARAIKTLVHDMLDAGAKDVEEAFDEARKYVYKGALEASGGNQTKAATSLRLNRDRFRYFIKNKLGM